MLKGHMAFMNALAWLVLVLSISGITQPPAAYSGGASGELRAANTLGGSEFIRSVRPAVERSARVVVRVKGVYHPDLIAPATGFILPIALHTVALLQQGSSVPPAATSTTTPVRGPPHTI